MKKNEGRNLLPGISLLICSLLTVFMSDAYAGDIRFSAEYAYRLIHAFEEQPVKAKVENIENYPVNGAGLKITIRHKLSLDLAYQWQTSLGTVEPKNSKVVEAPEPWIPQMTGKYRIFYQLSSLNDINPSNDTASYDIEVLPQPFYGFGFRQLNFIHPFQQQNSNTARIDFTVPPGDTTVYANFLFNTTTREEGAKWLVQNVPLPAFPDTQQVSAWIDLGELGIPNGKKVSGLFYNYTIGNEPVDQNWKLSLGLLYHSKLYEDDYDVPDSNPSEWEFELPYFKSEFDWNSGFKVKTWNYRGSEVPSIDLDSSVYNPRDISGEVGDWNCCGPASATNSLQWLENTNKNIPKTNTTHREKVGIFNKLSNRANEDGINTGNLIRGKLAYIDSFKLPLHVKWQGVPYDTTIASPNPKYKHFAQSRNDSVSAPCTFEWLASEFEKGEDIEIKFGWYDSVGHRHGAHWVVVSGVSDVTTARGVYVKDDEKQRGSGGLRQTYVNWVTNDKGQPRLVGFKAVNNYCWVESVVSESFDSTITYGIDKIKIEKPMPASHSFLDNFFKTGWLQKGLFSFDILPSATNKFLNVKVKNKETGEISWAVRNLLLPTLLVPQRMSVWFELEMPSFTGLLKTASISSVYYDYEVTEEAQPENELFLESWKEIEVIETPVALFLNNGETETSGVPNPGIVNDPNEGVGSLQSLVYRGNEMPNIDLDSSAYNPETVDNYAGDKNACGPASAANSLEWLELKHTEIQTGLNLRGKLIALSGLMLRANNNGTGRFDFIKAKLAFIDEYKLPVKVKFQSWKITGDSIASPNVLYGHSASNLSDVELLRPDWEWLVQEMENGEDVEMEIGFYDSIGVRTGGHWVVLTGMVKNGNHRGVFFNDDLNQLEENGTRIQFATWDTTGAYPFLRELSDESQTCYIETVVTEHYDENVSFIPFFSEGFSSVNGLNLKVYENPGSVLHPVNVDFNLDKAGVVALYIYDITGRLVFSEEKNYSVPGHKAEQWDGRGSTGNKTGSGTFIVVVKTTTQKSAATAVRY